MAFSRRIRFRPHSFLAKAALLALAGGIVLYNGAVLCGYLYLKQAGLHVVRWTDVVLPTRWHRVRMARGDHQLAVAHAHARAGRLSEAVAYARSGLAKSPAHRHGRLLFVHLLAVTNLRAAEAALLDGLQYHGNDPRYLSAVFAFLHRRLEDTRAVQVANEILGDRKRPLDALQVAAHAAATASYLRGNYDEADDFLRRVAELTDTREGRLLAAKIDWDRGFRELALAELRALGRAFPGDAQIHGELVAALHQAERRDQARRQAVAFQIAQPHLIAARLELLRAYRNETDPAPLTREIESLLHDFPASADALSAIGDFAADCGDVALVRRVGELARERRFPLEPHAFLLIEAHIVARDYAGAFAALDRLTQEHPTWATDYRSLLDSLRAIASLGVGDVEASQLYLANFLQQPALRADNLRALADRFVALSAPEQAREVLLRAVAADPLNQAALTRLIELELELNRIDELPSRLDRLLAMRKPSPDLLRVAQHKLGSDLFLFSRDRGPTLDRVAAALERHRSPRLSARFPAVP